MTQGRLLGGRYALDRALGAGGFGTVYRAEDVTLKRTVAVKLLNLDAALPPPERSRITERFLREAQALAALTHPNIVVCHDFGMDDNTAFMIMELVTGRSLADEEVERAARQAGPIDATEAVYIGSQICAGLGAAHAAGVVHRDLKPANVMLSEAGNVKIVDFGIARLAEQSRLTRTGMYVGTYAYSAPEQASMAAIDGRADLYSLGCMIHEMVSGRYAYNAESDLQWMKAHQMEAPTPLRVHAPNAPASLEALVLALLAKDPNQRPPTAEAVQARLQAIARELPPRGERRYAPRSAATPSTPSPAPVAPSPIPHSPIAPPASAVPAQPYPPQPPIAQPAYHIPAPPPQVGYAPAGAYRPGYPVAAAPRRARKVPVAAWVFFGVVIVAAVVLVVVFTTGGSGGGGSDSNAGCATLKTKVLPLDSQLQTDEDNQDIDAISSDFSQIQQIVDQAAGESSGQTASDMRQFSEDLGEAVTDMNNLDADALESISGKISDDGDAVATDCGFNASF